jgi:hypothetical protein
MYFSHDNQKQVIVKWQQYTYSVPVSHFANILIHLKSHFLINIAKLKYDVKMKYATIDGLLCIEYTKFIKGQTSVT